MHHTSMLTISEVEQLTGVSATRIRQWEQRLGWPMPVRSGGGARRYAASIVPDIREAQRRISCGR
jgi:DNA-binding transcriptional MerR regulator